MAADPITLNICDQKTLTVLSTYEWQSDSFTIWDIVNSVWFEVTDKKWWDILEHNLRVTSNASGQWYINVHTLDVISNFHALYKYVEPEIVESFFLDWVKYQLWWWDEAAWWNISWTLSDQTDLQNALNSKQNTLTAWENIKIASNVISANNVFIITEDDVTVSTDDTKWVAPYNTSYGYTNIDISASAGIEWREWAIYTFVVDTEMVVASAYRNVRVKIWTWTYIPVMWTTASLAWSSYFTKTNIRQFQYSTKYEAGWALHLFTDSNTTYTAMSVSEWKTATATTVRWMRSDYLKQIIKYHSVDDTAYASSWNGVTDIAPSKNAVYDKIAAMDTTISWKQNTLATQTAYTSKWSATKVPQITTNTLWQVTGITEVDITHPSQVDDTAYASSWNGVTSTAPSKNAVYDKISAMDTTISWKQDALTAQTAYTSKWTSSKVPQITTNTLWQVTWITEVDISYPSQIDNTAYWSSWNGVTNKAPTKDAVYDKINAIDWQIADLQAHWKFLSLWNSATWLPISFPLTTPYTYSTWDYYMVETLPSSGSKYMPNGSSYSGTASTTVDSVNEVKVWDMYIYDGSTWLYASNHWKDVTFSNIAWNPSDNTNLATALNGKQDKLSAQTAYTSKGTASKVPQITTNTLWQVTGITEVDISYPSQVSDVAYASSWNWVTAVAPSKNVVYDKINAMDTIIAGKQDALTAQTAYSAKGSATKVPQITTNSLWQVTGITEVTITHPSQVSDDYYSSSWDWVTTIAPSKNAVYDKISDMDSIISGKASAADVNTKTFTILDTTDTSTLQAAIDWYIAGKMPLVRWRSSTFILSSFQYTYDWQLNAHATFTQISTVSSGDLIRYKLNIDCTGDTISTVTETQETLISNTAYSSSWNGVTGTAPSKNAVYDKISAMDTTIAWKQNALSTQTAYTSKGSATKVPQITTNSLWQVTWITEVDIQAWETYNAGEWIGIVSVHSDMQWPAPDGFHVPLNTEWQSVYDIWTALGWWSSAWTNFWIALKLPFAGYRIYSSAGVGSQGTYGDYWSSSRYDANKAYCLYFDSFGLYPQSDSRRAGGYSVRCFKNTPTVPTSSWTKLYWTSIEAGWIFWSSTDWLISLSSDWNTWITIADKNLWATTVWNSWDTLSEANCGYYYQRWNNYGFPRTWSVTTSSTQVDASTYWPWNYYSSSTFITRSSSPYSWDSTDNWNLWWWVSQWTWIWWDWNTIVNTGVLSVNGQTWDVTLSAWDMSYSDFWWQAKTWATITLDLASTYTPSADFTVNAPATIKDWQTYILRVNNEDTAYTMTLWTNVTNPFGTDITLTDYWIDQFVFLAIGWKLELQPEWWGWGWAITADTTWTTTSISKIWVGTEAEYQALWTYEENVAYMTY